MNDHRSGSQADPSRREALVRLGLTAAALSLGCECRPSQRAAPVEPSPTAPPLPATAEPSPPPPIFPTGEARGAPREIGRALGELAREPLIEVINAQRSWLERLRAFAMEDRAARFDPFWQATRRHFPEVYEELQGIAEGAQRPLEDILLWNLQPELGMMLAEAPRAGCSTLHLVADGQVVLAHNEDGADAYHQRLLVATVHPDDGPDFTSLVYPGQVPGQVPAMNAAGLVVSTNYIGTREVRPGIPRYVLGRAIHRCSTIEQAVAVATHRDRAFAFTANLGSVPERRLACLELTPSTHDLRESRGLFIHTNHLVLPDTREVPERSDAGPSTSTGSRYQVLEQAAAQSGDLSTLGREELVQMLASHEALRQPYSPCRHPGDGSSTRTLATALFDLVAGSFEVFEGNPCEASRRRLELPA